MARLIIFRFINRRYIRRFENVEQARQKNGSGIRAKRGGKRFGARREYERAAGIVEPGSGESQRGADADERRSLREEKTLRKSERRKDLIEEDNE